MRVFAIINHKGGSTKTTTTEHIADILTESGASVCLIDLDTSYNLTNFYNIAAKKNIIHFLNVDKIDLAPKMTVQCR
ncbi:MAG TPA: AAA family ATPase [Candidatus Omnitrophota bacterium]|nr:AAA family ATPase [Candidatus Omnitrophota bacterium]